MFKKTRKGKAARAKLMSLLMAMIFVFTLTGTAFAAEVTTADGSANVQTGEGTDATEENVVDEVLEAVNPEANWMLQPIGEQVTRIKKGQVYNDAGVVLLDEEGNVQYICLPDKVGVTVLDQMGNRRRDLEAGFIKIGTVANQYEGSYTLLYSFRGKLTYKVVLVSKDLEALPEGKDAPVDSLNFSLKPKGNYELVVKQGQELKDGGVQVYDQYWKEHKELESKVTKSEIDMEKLGYQLLKYELNGKTVVTLVRVVEQSQKLNLKFSDKNVSSQNKMRVGVGSKIVLPEAKIRDSSGKEQSELWNQVVIRGNFDTNKEGTYTLVYDLEGRQLTLTIEVVKNLKATNDDNGSSNSSDSNWDPPHGGGDDNTGDNTGGNTGDNTGGNTGDNTGGNTGDNTGDNTGGNTGDNTGGDKQEPTIGGETIQGGNQMQDGDKKEPGYEDQTSQNGGQMPDSDTTNTIPPANTTPPADTTPLADTTPPDDTTPDDEQQIVQAPAHKNEPGMGDVGADGSGQMG